MIEDTLYRCPRCGDTRPGDEFDTLGATDENPLICDCGGCPVQIKEGPLLAGAEE